MYTCTTGYLTKRGGFSKPGKWWLSDYIKRRLVIPISTKSLLKVMEGYVKGTDMRFNSGGSGGKDKTLSLPEIVKMKELLSLVHTCEISTSVSASISTRKC